jgi:ribulose kinase
MVIAIVTLEIDALAFVVGIVAAQSGHLWALFGTARETEV